MAARTTSSFLRQLRPSALRQPCSVAAASRVTLLGQQPPSSLARRPAVLVRAAHTIPRPPRPSQRPTEPAAAVAPSSSQDTSDAASPAWQPADEPASEGERPEAKNPAYYQLSFTCVPCGHRSHHNVSKQGYHTGSILITCPSCRNRHVISDHLNIFGDRKLTVEDLMREKGRLVKRGSLGEDGDIEFWPDEEEAAATPETDNKGSS